MRHAEVEKPARHAYGIAALAMIAVTLLGAVPGSAGTLDRIRDSGKLTLGYEEDARPFSFTDEAGKPAGYSVALCQEVAKRIKAELKINDLAVSWVPLKLADRFNAVKQGTVDILCGADSETLARRQEVGFSLPIFPSGIGAVVRADAPAPLREILEYGKPSTRPVWRGYPALTFLQNKTFSIVKDATSEKWLAERLDALNIAATIVPVKTHDEGIGRVLDGSSDAFFADLPILLDAAARNKASGDLTVLGRRFTFERLALVIARNDDDFRLVVDRALSGIYRSNEFPDLYASWFGQANTDEAKAFFQQAALPE